MNPFAMIAKPFKDYQERRLTKSIMNEFANEAKSLNIYDILRSALPGLIKEKFNIPLSKAIMYYCSVSAVGKAIEMLADEFASLEPKLWNKKTKEWESNDNFKDLFKLLNRPNPDMTRWEYSKRLAAYYLMSGNAYQEALGLLNKGPVELEVISPAQAGPCASEKDNYAESYETYGRTGYKTVYKRRETINGFRYESGDGKELWHIKTFNPGLNPLVGMSKLDQVYYEVEQHLKSSIHNLSMLEKGARPSGILTSEQNLQKDQKERVKETLRQKVGGYENAGDVLLLTGAKFSFQEMGKSMKDMDFLNLKKEVMIAIYNAYNIPLPLVTTDTMTLANYSEARIALYDNGVLPLADRMFEEQSNFLFPRFKIDGDTYQLTYDVGEIPALEPRRNEQNKVKKESGVLTINEVRALYGYKPITGGDTLYQPFNLQPIGETIPESVTAEKFIDIMRAQINSDGARMFPDDVIEGIARERGILR